MSRRLDTAGAAPLPARWVRRPPLPSGPPSLALGPPRLLKSAGFRFAALFAAMFAFAAVALVAVLWWANSRACS